MKSRKKIRKPDRKMPAPNVKMNRTTQRKLLKAVAEPQRTPGPCPVPSGNEIVLTGLVLVEAGKALGRLCVCTSDSLSNDTFFISMKGTEARCPRCKETHPIVDFKTAAAEGTIDLAEAVFCIGPRELLGILFGKPNPRQRRFETRAATS